MTEYDEKRNSQMNDCSSLYVKWFVYNLTWLVDSLLLELSFFDPIDFLL